MRTGYETGTWWVLVVPSGAVAVPPHTEEGLVDRLWDVLHGESGRRPGGLNDVVDALTAHVGGALSNIPPFVAVLQEGDDARVAVRGRVSARVRTHTSEEVVTGAEVTTWSERLVASATGADLLLEEPMSGRTLPVVSGVVAASRVKVEFDAQLTDGAVAVPAAEPAMSAPEAASDGPTGTPPVPDENEGEPILDEPEPAPGPVPVPDRVPAPEPASEHTLVSATTIVPNGDGGWSEPVAAAYGDHDGATISLAQLRAQRGTEPPSLSVSPLVAAPPPAVSGVADVPDATATAVFDVTGPRIRLSTGQVLALDRAVIIGRRPRSTRASGDSMPHLVAVDSPNHDISRSHLELRPEAGACVAIDLHTTNGSTLLRPGHDPVRLHPGEQTVVVDGDVIDLGDGVTVTVEESP